MGLLGVCDIDDLIKLVSTWRGRPITVRAEPLPVSAACGSSLYSDSIVVDCGASALTQLHAKIHELGHLLFDAPSWGCEHSTEAHEPMALDLARQLFPGLKADEVSTFFKRSRYDSKQERRVEIFATVMLEVGSGAVLGPRAASCPSRLLVAEDEELVHPLGERRQRGEEPSPRRPR
ncbi:hypothetical protein ABZW47_31495 [Streptomyces sp. NPDC004549]|uniref:hypothetical protein n=1 Tax=Streptomyces sp. NPDC004549 TaxID=3154283 RepID=UPI00339FBD20